VTIALGAADIPRISVIASIVTSRRLFHGALDPQLRGRRTTFADQRMRGPR
jgi:hypothetical protein